nr:MAG TPA: hypothetical protein [Caudoviricetes sp.]
MELWNLQRKQEAYSCNDKDCSKLSVVSLLYKH